MRVDDEDEADIVSRVTEFELSWAAAGVKARGLRL